jgi:hypothetical protein
LATDLVKAPTAEGLFNDKQPAKRKAPRHSYDEDNVRRYPRRNTCSKSQLGNFIVSNEEGKPILHAELSKETRTPHWHCYQT